MTPPRYEDESFQQRQALAQADYENCTFTNCQLANTDLSGSIFEDCTFEDCDLSGVNLHETALQTVRFARCKLLGVHFEDCRDFRFAVSMQDCNLELATFIDWKLKGTSFAGCRMAEVDFTGADLQEAKFDECDLSRATFERTDLRKADFRTARNFQFSPEENRVSGTLFSVSGLPGLLAEYGIIVE